VTPNGTGVLVRFWGANGYLNIQGTPTLNLSAPTAAKSGRAHAPRQFQHVDHWGGGANAIAASSNCPPGSAPTPTLLIRWRGAGGLAAPAPPVSRMPGRSRLVVDVLGVVVLLVVRRLVGQLRRV